MKALKLMLYALLLSSVGKFAYACSYYPMGEDIRISLFSSNIGDGMDMEDLFYSAHFFNTYTQKELNGPNENLDEWYAWFGGKFKRNTIDELIYRSSVEKPLPEIYKNSLYKHFKEGNDKEISEYIVFAKKVEYYLMESYWGDKEMDIPNSKKALKEALTKINTVKTDMLKLRYGYQAMVLSYYLNEFSTGISVYEKTILPLKSESVLATWCLFHKSNMIDDPYDRWRLQAIVFEKSRSKNKYIFQHFPTDEVKVRKILERCKSDEEKAAVYSILAFKNPARAIDQLDKIVKLNPKTSLLDVLLVREINKMEDWYYTNRYTGYGPAISDEDGWWGERNEAFTFIDEKNFESDRKYLLKITNWAKTQLRVGAISNQTLWLTSVAYMSYMLDDKEDTYKYLELALKSNPERIENGQIKTIQILALVKFEKNWNHDFQNELYERIKGIERYTDVLYNYDRFYGQLMMAVSRKYLEDGNVVLAALFETKVTGGTYEYYYDWAAPQYQGFDLLDVNATPEDMDEFFTLWNKKNKTNLEKWLFEGMEEWRWRYTDLWGTTYFRAGNLEKALAIYETVPDSVWKVDNYDLHYHYAQELNANPFDTRFSRTNFNDDRSVTYTKPEFIREILRLKKSLAEGTSKNRAYDYMLLGNAYFNMTEGGNSWYYTEYGLGSYYRESKNNEEFHTGDKALYYYKMAEKESKSEKFSAFCYRLQYKCIELKAYWLENGEAFRLNYQRTFKSRYPKHYLDLQGCDYFYDYFDTWKDA